MFPRWHIILSLIFAGIFWLILPETQWYYILIIFFSGFLIDFDHYAVAVSKTGKLSLNSAFRYHRLLDIAEKKRQKKGIFRKGDFHLFHTLEFHAFVFALGFIWPLFFYVLMGMLFHSISDFIYLVWIGETYRREFFLTNWVKRKAIKEN